MSYAYNYDDPGMYTSGRTTPSSASMSSSMSMPASGRMTPMSGRMTPLSGRMTPNTPGGGYAPGPGIATVRHAQINSPLGLYNSEAVAEEFSRQTGGIVTGVAGLPAKAPADPRSSATYAAVRGEEKSQHNYSPSYRMVDQMSQPPPPHLEAKAKAAAAAKEK